ncbi:hypothetical protein BC830DRAFT_638210 [Chytriomyces sp. MP71]|nr:hypothetical protein BC830DRAFT_638210 [Chytriomyces sp. MP71]
MWGCETAVDGEVSTVSSFTRGTANVFQRLPGRARARTDAVECLRLRTLPLPSTLPDSFSRSFLFPSLCLDGNNKCSAYCKQLKQQRCHIHIKRARRPVRLYIRRFYHLLIKVVISFEVHLVKSPAGLPRWESPDSEEEYSQQGTGWRHFHRP